MTHVALPTINVLELCAGAGMLGVGFSRGCELAGLGASRSVCLVERESYAAAVLATRMEEGDLAPAPIWSDLLNFDGRPWRGVVQAVIAGLPCQPFSVAGSQRGHEDERAIWPVAFDIIEQVRPALVFLENVPGQLQFFRPIGERLCDMGFRFEAGLFSAEEVGASHKRERFFVLAVANGELHNWTGNTGKGRRREFTDDDDDDMGTISGELLGPEGRNGAGSAGDEVVGDSNNRGSQAGSARRGEVRHGGPGNVGSETPESDSGMADSQRERSAPRSSGEARRPERNTARTQHDSATLPRFAPGPNDPRWPAIIAERPDLCPFIVVPSANKTAPPQQSVRRDVNGLADRLDGDLDANENETRCREELPSLQETNVEEEIQRKDRGSRDLCSEEVLRSKVHGGFDGEARGIETRIPATHSPVERSILRTLFYSEEAGDSPQRQELEEQRLFQFADAVLLLSHLLAPPSRGHQSSHGKAMRLLREGFAASHVQYVQDEESAQWLALSEADMERIFVGAYGRWLADNRVDQLRIVGNGVVPDTATLAVVTLWKRLMEETN